MAGKTASRKRRGSRGPCSYCGRVHRKGKTRGDSCRGHKPIASNTQNQKRIDFDKFS